MSYSEIKSEEALEKALSLAKGCYQRNLILGSEPLSGAGLRGKARHWSGRYAESRCNLMKRLRKAGVASERIGAHGKRILVIGE
jgi:hypothetical protein